VDAEGAGGVECGGGGSSGAWISDVFAAAVACLFLEELAVGTKTVEFQHIGLNLQ
jgi:hypothetical protein